MCSKCVDHPRFNFQNNREDLNIDQSMLEISHTLIMNTTFIQAAHSMRKMATGTIWIC
jgi:hypothetical protein